MHAACCVFPAFVLKSVVSSGADAGGDFTEGHAMEERLKHYLRQTGHIVDELEKERREGVPENGKGSCDRIRKEKQELLVQIGFFQHERLVHLLVTVLFALLTMLVFIQAVTAFSLWSGVLLLSLLVLLVPYIRHYYILENGTQKLYQYYDRLEALLKDGGDDKGQRKAGTQDVVVKEIDDAGTKCSIARAVLEALPEWFELREAREDYIKKSAEQLFFAAFREESPVGFLCLTETGKDTAELAVMGVLKQYHRQGIGRALFEAARVCALQKGYSFLQVKTVQMGHYEDYDRTNRFYQSLGFKELEVLSTLWDEANPCQIYVRKTEGDRLYE